MIVDDRLTRLRVCVTLMRDAGALKPGDEITGLDDLATLPVLRKSDLGARQKSDPPFGGIPVKGATHVFQSPGPVYEPGALEGDWWRLGRFLHSCGIGAGDVVQNCFAYHLTPAGHMFESGARAVGATVLPAGTGQTEHQVRAAADLGVTVYAGTPDYLKIILDKADEMGERLAITRAAVSGGALFPALRQGYADRGIACLQCYATADLGLIAHEVEGTEGMVIDDDVIVEIVTPGTGDPVEAGEVGEVVVTALTQGYPLIRFATGDLSAMLDERRIKGWMGRADQTAKVKGMFVRPEQVAQLVARHDEVDRARVIIRRDGDADAMLVQLEARGGAEAESYADSVRDILKLRGAVEIVSSGTLPRDGKVIDDQRSYD